MILSLTVIKASCQVQGNKNMRTATKNFAGELITFTLRWSQSATTITPKESNFPPLKHSLYPPTSQYFPYVYTYLLCVWC